MNTGLAKSISTGLIGLTALMLAACATSRPAASPPASAPPVVAADTPVAPLAPAVPMPPTAPASAAAATAVTPIFSQLLAVGMPAGFVLINENASERRYLREAVLRGENEETWTQMLSVTGTRDLAQKPDATPERFAETISENFQRACPESFNQKTLAADDSNGYQRYIAVMSCGTAGAAATPISETALIMVVKGRRDYYTVQWAERGAASKDALSIDTRKWVQRYQLLMPVRVCDRVADEAPPYPSCLKQ